jgi:alcohol dehydrogenase class IV
MVTAISGIDTLAHALDALGSVKANPVSDALAVKAAKLVFANLKPAVDNGSDHVNS